MTSVVMCKHVFKFCCPLVIILLLQSNQISAQCQVTNVRGVKTADCAGRRLRSIPSAQSVDIRALRLADNLISSLVSDGFRSFGPTLIDLNLARNDISSVDDAAFRGLHGIQVVDLESNLLQSIPTEALREIPSVRILVFKNNHIRSIGPEDLGPLSNIEELNFENCRLQQIAPGAFRRLVRLLELNLADNELITLDPATEGQLPTSLTVVRLTGNPWLCDCRLRWLRKWLAASTAGADNVTSPQQQIGVSSLSAFNWDLAPSIPTCSGPAGSSLAGVDWRSIQPQQFACPARVRLISPIITENQGGDADVPDDVMSAGLPETVVAIRCIATGDPLPVITWSQVTPDGVLHLTSNANVNVHRNNLDSLLSPPRENHQQIVESVLSISAEQHQQISETPTGSAEFKCQAENSAGKDQATYRVNTLRLNSRFIVVSTAYDHRRVEQQTTPSGIRLAEPEVLIGCGMFAVCLLTVLVIGVVCWTAVSARSAVNRLGDSVINKKPDDVNVVSNNVDAAVISTPGSVDNLSHVTESVLSSLNTAVVWQKGFARPSAAVWGSFVRSQSSSCATHAVGNGMHPGILDQSETGSISLRQFDTRSVFSCGGFSEYEDDVLEEKMAADFRFRLFEPRKPWSVSDGDVRLVPRRENCSTGLEEAYDRRRVLTVRHVMTSKHAHDFRPRSSAISRCRPTAATRLVGSRNEYNVAAAAAGGGGMRRFPGSFTKPQTVYGTAAAVAMEYQI